MREKAVLLVSALVLLVLALDGTSQMASPKAINPKSYRSPSGQFVWEVDPGDVYGRGEAHYRLLNGGKVIWEGKQPFTLYEAAVTDSGLLAGYAYTHGEEGFTENGIKDGMGEFLVAILDASGAIRLKDAVPRETSRFPDDLPNPLARGMFVDQANNRLVVRLRDPDLNRRIESWWIYELSSGKTLGKLELKPGDGKDASPIQALPIVGTPLTLIDYWQYESPNANARFALVNPSLKEVWSMTWRRDYNLKDEAAEDRLRERIWAQGAILNASTSNQFELFAAKTSERVAFSVLPSAKDKTKWTVQEIARKTFTEAKVMAEKPPTFRKEPLKPLGSFSFQEEQAATDQAFRNIFGFGFDDRNRIGFLRRGESKGVVFALVEDSGRVLREVSLAGLAKDFKDPEFKSAWVEGDRWVVTVSEPGMGGKTSAWWLNGASGELASISGFTCPEVKSLAGLPKGGFVALAVNHHKYSMGR